jgi:hypothetical protein
LKSNAPLIIAAFLAGAMQPGTMPVQVVSQPRDLWVTVKAWQFDGQQMGFVTVTLRAADIHQFPAKGPGIPGGPSALILTGQVYPFTYAVPGTASHWNEVLRDYFSDPNPATFTTLE